MNKMEHAQRIQHTGDKKQREWDGFSSKYGGKSKHKGCKTNKLKCLQVRYSLGPWCAGIKTKLFQKLKKLSKERFKNSDDKKQILKVQVCEALSIYTKCEQCDIPLLNLTQVFTRTLCGFIIHSLILGIWKTEDSLVVQSLQKEISPLDSGTHLFLLSEMFFLSFSPIHFEMTLMVVQWSICQICGGYILWKFESTF